MRGVLCGGGGGRESGGDSDSGAGVYVENCTGDIRA